MRGSEVKGAVAFVIFLALAVLFLLGFLLFAVVLIAVGLLVFIGFYIYIRLKLWWVRRHPPKELERPEDYF
ncbi:hypothetical protein [Thermococcus nautili]|uniref:Uncharacterized protein n=1 Tax=Thermococcus nautili TaxID=195522 RepID=W8NSY4_9EURY|nr:hypothetical protein [Thermococcus nautili]AHL22207.1 hypothetical protein BD01_0583 [Thermococcus nautili]CAI1493744.1 conserved protein of unknown function [Thermococcus nautili]